MNEGERTGRVEAVPPALPVRSEAARQRSAPRMREEWGTGSSRPKPTHKTHKQEETTTCHAGI